jgi:DNA modification methylase
MKPVELVAHMVGNSSKVNSIILDPFLGSGTTMIAAEQLNRRCYGMEIAPCYVDVSVRRWQKLTNQEPVLEATGKSFSEVAAERGVEIEA